ncbi:MAG: TetR/AcrR family transcriptional regulator, partial [Tissierellales bacterium]|nr:TetR/AcrR family transcriptional regulator [Tissierellales bacterium]
RCDMEEKYRNIDIKNEKVLSIINASFEVFAKNDIEKASTNMIVKQAGVSRGLLYHYFKDKDELFDFLVYYSVRIMVENIETKLDWKDTDFLRRIQEGIILKCEIIDMYPYIIEFLEKYSYRVPREDLKKEVETSSPGLMDRWYNQNLDFSSVKDGVDIDMMKKTIKSTFSELVRDRWNIKKTKGIEFKIEEVRSEFAKYDTFFRNQFYE